MKNFKQQTFWRYLTAVALFWFAGICASAQSVTTTGTVTDEEGEPLIGVSVMVQGTTSGTTTDIDGNYSIKASAGNKIAFSYVGMESQTRPAVNGQLNVILKSNTNALNDVVVVGYGVQRKSDVTGAIAKVDGSSLENLTVNSPTAALAGKTSGVQMVSTSGAPGATPAIRVRGYSSNSDMSPLYVVDGIRLDDISGIDPSTIESIEVLKDGASAAIYGAQAGNGVILITTKSAKTGGSSHGSVRYDFQYVNETFGHKPTMLNAAEYIEYMQEGKLFDMQTINNLGWDGKTDTNWFDVAFGNGTQMKHTVSLEGANERGGILATISYLNNDGPVRGDSDKYKRLSGTLNADYNIKPWLKFGTTAILERWQTRSVSTNDGWGSLMASVYAMDPLTANLYTAENMNSQMLQHKDQLLKNEDDLYYGVSNYQGSENAHPMVMRDKQQQKNQGYNVTGSVYAHLNVWKPLTITSRFGYKLSATQYNGYSQPYYGSSQSNTNEQSIESTTGNGIYYQWENFANYNQTFKDVHAVSAMAGLSFQKNIWNQTWGKAASTTIDETYIPAIPVPDPNLWGYLDYANADAIKNTSGNESISTQYSWFGRVGYTYDNKYMVQASLRADAYDSSKLPVTNRWGYFPSASVGWVMSQEDFMGWSRPALDYFKIRASYGKNGSVAPLGGYSYNPVIASFASGSFVPGWGAWNNAVYSFTTNGTTQWVNGRGPSNTGNDELSWETMTQWDFGFDARLFNNRFTFGFDYFHKTTDGLLVYGVTPTLSLGGVTSPINAGSVVNSGLEFDLGWQDRIGDFRYSINANVSTLRNKVTKIHESVPVMYGTSFSNINVTRFEVGEKVWHFNGYEYAGVNPENGHAWYWSTDENGKRFKTEEPAENDQTNIGDAIPDVTLGININLAYKGIDLLISGSGTFGNDVFMCIQRQDRLTTNRIKDVFYNDRWSSTNTGGSVPSAAALAGEQDPKYYLFSSAMVFDGSFFKIRQIQLGYTIPKAITRKVFVENFRAYVSLDDFFTFTKYPGFDPEVSAGTGASQGIDLGGYPTTRKVAVGFNITF